MATRSQSHQNDSDEDAAAPTIASNVQWIPITAVTKAMETANRQRNGPSRFHTQDHHVFLHHLPLRQRIVQDKDKGTELLVEYHHQDRQMVEEGRNICQR